MNLPYFNFNVPAQLGVGGIVQTVIFGTVITQKSLGSLPQMSITFPKLKNFTELFPGQFLRIM